MVTDCGSIHPLLGSDHRGISLTINLDSRVKKTSVDARSRLSGLDFSRLVGDEKEDAELRGMYASKVGDIMKTSGASTAVEGAGASRYDRLAEAMHAAACELLPKRGRAQPGWFEKAEDVLRRLIDQRNLALKQRFQ